MKQLVWLGVLTVVCTVQAQAPINNCKNPTIVERRMADDVRYASPFYVIALPNSPRSREIDNVCYSYFETESNSFFNIMSITYQNGSTSQYKVSKGDIHDRNGLAEGRADNPSSCVYHDYTLTPICNVSVFILYRCFIQGDCKEADVGVSPGVDVRVVLAASTSISEECRLETETSLRDTSSLEGGDYYILPQKHEPHCVTRYGDMQSINLQNALGTPITLPGEDTSLSNRIGDDKDSLFSKNTATEESSSGALHYLTQHTPQTTVPKRTYADVVKTHSSVIPKINLIPQENFFPYDYNEQNSCLPKCCSGS